MRAVLYEIHRIFFFDQRTFRLFKKIALIFAVFVGFAGSVSSQPARIEAAFSPGGGAQALVIKTIEAARQEISVLAYSFTSAPVAEALAKASKRGIRVQLVADGESNTSGGGAAKARAAMSALVSAGVSVRLVDAFAIHHDKVVIVDGRHVQTGSFNYSSSAERRNSENVLVVWDDPALARTYLTHFKRNWDLGKPYVTNY